MSRANRNWWTGRECTDAVSWYSHKLAKML